MRVHVHTLRPGQVLEFAVDHGTLARVKVENMQLQRDAFAAAAQRSGGAERRPGGVEHRRHRRRRRRRASEGLPQPRRARRVGRPDDEPQRPGDPDRGEQLGCKELVILPNNSNIILTARHVQELTPHSVAVIPTETAPQGIGALLAFNFQADMQTNSGGDGAGRARGATIEVTQSVRDAEVDGLSVEAGQFLGIADGRIVAASCDCRRGAGVGARDRRRSSDMEIVTIYFGNGAIARARRRRWRRAFAERTPAWPSRSSRAASRTTPTSFRSSEAASIGIVTDSTADLRPRSRRASAWPWCRSSSTGTARPIATSST